MGFNLVFKGLIQFMQSQAVPLRLIVILASIYLKVFKWSVSTSPHQNSVHISLLPHMCHMSHSSYLTNVLQGLQIMKILIQFSPVFFLLVSPKYLHNILLSNTLTKTNIIPVLPTQCSDTVLILEVLV